MATKEKNVAAMLLVLTTRTLPYAATDLPIGGSAPIGSESPGQYTQTGVPNGARPASQMWFIASSWRRVQPWEAGYGGTLG